MLSHDVPFVPPGLGRGRRAITTTSPVTTADQGIVIDATSGTYDVTTATAASTFGSGFAFGLYNSGTGVVTFNPSGSETVRSPSGTATTFALTQGQGIFVSCDGTNWDIIADTGVSPSPTTPVTVYDNAFTIADEADTTKKMVFSVGPQGSGFTFTFNVGVQTASFSGTLPVMAANSIFAMSAAALTTLRIPIATTGGLLSDNANLFYSSDILYANSLASGFLLANSTDALITIYAKNAASSSVRSAITQAHTTGVLTFNSDIAANGTARGFDFQTFGTSRLTMDASGNLAATSTGDATSTITGSFITAGGVGIAKALWVGGLVNIAGNITQTGATTLSTGTGAVSLNGATSVINQTFTVRNDGADTTSRLDNYNSVSATTTGNYQFRRSRGSFAAATGISSGDWIGAVGFTGHNGTSLLTNNRAIIGVITTELWSLTANGAKMAFYTTPNTTTSVAVAMEIGQDKGVSVLGTADATSTITGSITTLGGMSCAKSLWVGEDLNLTAIAGIATNGSLWHDSTQEALQTYTSGIEQTLVGCIFTQTATRTIADTVTETSLLTTGVGTLTLPANFFAIGKTIRVMLIGNVADTGTPTVTIKLKYGATNIIDSGAITFTALTGTEEWQAVCDITCRTIGVSGTLAGNVWLTYDTTTGAGAVNGLDIAAAVATVDTTASGALDLTFQWGTASASNTISSVIATVEVLN